MAPVYEHIAECAVYIAFRFACVSSTAAAPCPITHRDEGVACTWLRHLLQVSTLPTPFCVAVLI